MIFTEIIKIGQKKSVLFCLVYILKFVYLNPLVRVQKLKICKLALTYCNWLMGWKGQRLAPCNICKQTFANYNILKTIKCIEVQMHLLALMG